MTLNNPLPLITINLLGIGFEISYYTDSPNTDQPPHRMVSLDINAVIKSWGFTWRLGR